MTSANCGLALVIVSLFVALGIGTWVFIRWWQHHVDLHLQNRNYEREMAEYLAALEAAENLENQYPYANRYANPYHMDYWGSEAARNNLLPPPKVYRPEGAEKGWRWGDHIPGKKYVPGATPSDPGGYVGEKDVHWAPNGSGRYLAG